jgi:hypothetical protein
VQRVVEHVHRAVRTHRQRLADRLGGVRRAHGEHGDLATVRFLDLQRLLDGVLVHLVDDVVGRPAVHCVVVSAQVALGAGVRHLLDEYDDLHRSPTPLIVSWPSSGQMSERTLAQPHVTSE